jgi:hypothetical protein
MIEAENHQDAFNMATKQSGFDHCPIICIFSGWAYYFGFGLHWYSNPNYKRPEKLDIEKPKESRSEQPERSDGSVGWFENVEGSHLTEKQILLAQLAELRIIKRCVVGTVVIAIVIPVIVGGIISG